MAIVARLVVREAPTAQQTKRFCVNFAMLRRRAPAQGGKAAYLAGICRIVGHKPKL
ncbi:hypothetical protein [Azospirillum sp. sgz302134]